MATHKVDLRIEFPAGTPIGNVVVGIPEDQFLELKDKVPDKEWSGRDPRVNEAIKDGITKEETERIAAHLRLPADTKLTLQFEGMSRYVDEAKEKPSFESSGKKFWIKLRQR